MTEPTQPQPKLPAGPSVVAKAWAKTFTTCPSDEDFKAATIALLGICDRNKEHVSIRDLGIFPEAKERFDLFVRSCSLFLSLCELAKSQRELEQAESGPSESAPKT